jgi:hypothetical protein
LKGAVHQRGSTWYYKSRLPERDSSTGRYPWITKGGFDTEREAWKACREAIGDADRGRVVKPSTRLNAAPRLPTHHRAVDHRGQTPQMLPRDWSNATEETDR